MLVIAITLMLLAMACLALAMDRHHAQWFGTALSPRRQRLLRTAGLITMAVLLALLLASRAPAQAAVDAVVGASLAALVVCGACALRARAR